jgi:hypothetical protein
VLSFRGFDDTCIAHSVNLEYTNDGDTPLLPILTRPHIRTSVHPYIRTSVHPYIRTSVRNNTLFNI